MKKEPIFIPLFKVSAWLDERGFDYRLHRLEVKVTDKSFVGDGFRIDKEKVGRIDTIVRETHRLLRYFTYCKEGEQQKSLDMLTTHIIEKVNKYKQEIDVLHTLASSTTLKIK